MARDSINGCCRAMRCGVLVALVCAGASVARAEEVTVAVSPDVRFQTIRGWSANPWYPRIAPKLRDQLVDVAVNDLGLTRLRWGQPNGNRWLGRSWEWENDDGDPNHINPKAFNTWWADKFAELWVKPFKERVEKNGEPFELWISPSFFDGGSTGSAPAWLLHSPGEYAEFATSFLLHLKNTHGIEAKHYVILNEPGNNNPFKPPVVARMIRTLGPRLKALGLPTTIQFPDGVNAATSWRFIEHVKTDPEIWRHVTLLSYHLYGRNDPFRSQIRDFAKSRDLPTGQTEFMGLTIGHLYDDLTRGGVSYWSIYGLAGTHAGAGNFRLHLSNTTFWRGRRFWTFRQVMHYVRPGAVRVKADSDDEALRVLAFVHNERTTIVLINTLPPKQDRTVAVQGLAGGTYGVCQAVGSRVYEELGVRTVGDSGSLTVTVPQNAVLTIYPRSADNLPPTVTDWRADPVYLTAPAHGTALMASAVDPDGDALSYQWKVTRQPRGAKVTLVTPKATRTSADGLTRPGLYTFTVTISDGANAVTRDVLFRVFPVNQPPITLDVHNRIPVTVTLPTDNTLLRAAAHDLERDPLTFKWNVHRQPKDADARLETPEKPGCKVTNMTVPGDYAFRLEVRDHVNVTLQDLTVTVYPENQSPTITQASARPARVAAGGSVRLSARTEDPDGDTITHWWSVKQKPLKAKPIFTNQGAARTAVRNLTEPGKYVFTLAVIDRTKVATADVVVTVTP